MPDLWTPENIMHSYIVLDEDRRVAGDTHQMDGEELDYYHELEPLGVPSSDVAEYYIGPVDGMRTNIARRLIDLTLTPKQLSIANHGRELIQELTPPGSFPVVPRRKHLIAAAAEGKIESIQDIKDEFDTLDNFYRYTGLVTYGVTQEWTEQEWKDNYDWLRELYALAGKTVPPIKELIAEVGPHNIGPTETGVLHRWKTFSAYGKHVQPETKHYKRTLSHEGFRRAIIDNALDNGGLIDTTSVKNDQLLLGRGNIERRAGGIQKTNLVVLDRITGARDWNKDMFLWWGLTRFIPKTERLPTYTDIDIWSRAKEGPSRLAMLEQFDHSIYNFHDELIEARQWRVQQVRTLSQTQEGSLPLSRQLVIQAMRRNPELFHVGKDIEPSEITILQALANAEVNQGMIASYIKSGISLSEPEQKLNSLMAELHKHGMLNSTVLRRLEPYIVGLAPLRPEMSWYEQIGIYLVELNRKAA